MEITPEDLTGLIARLSDKVVMYDTHLSWIAHKLGARPEVIADKEERIAFITDALENQRSLVKTIVIYDGALNSIAFQMGLLQPEDHTTRMKFINQCIKLRDEVKEW